MDYLMLKMSKGGFQHVLVITDHFTRFAMAIPTNNQTARTTADALWRNFRLHYGFPVRLHSDQGANFSSKIIKELCAIAGMNKSRTTPYHAMGNGMCERFNRTLLNMLGTLEEHQKVDWKSYVGAMVHAYNCTKHESTGYSPFHLMFGREPRLPIDLVLGIGEAVEGNDYNQFISSLRERLQKAYQLASENAKQSQQKQKRNYDLRVHAAGLQSGDRVLVKALAFTGKHKLADRWESKIYEVVSQPNPDIPVYVVQLLPVGSLPVQDVSEVQNKQTFPQVKKNKLRWRQRSPSVSETSSSESSSDEDELLVVYQSPQDNVTNQTDEGNNSSQLGENQATEVKSRETGQKIRAVEADSDQALPPTPAPRRSARARQPPDRYGTWVYQQQTLRETPLPAPRKSKCKESANELQDTWISKAELLRNLVSGYSGTIDQLLTI